MFNKEILLPSCSQGIQLAENERLMTIGRISDEEFFSGSVVYGYASSSPSDWSSLGQQPPAGGKLSAPFEWPIIPGVSLSLLALWFESDSDERFYLTGAFGVQGQASNYDLALNVDLVLNHSVYCECTVDTMLDFESENMPFFQEAFYADVWYYCSDDTYADLYQVFPEGFSDEGVGKTIIVGIECY